MTASSKMLGQDPAFDRFLGASVGEDERGTTVTVLSMLARLDVDPWVEASDLAAMPDSRAQKRLGALMARFDDVPTLVPDRARIASQLLAFLPRREAAAKTSSYAALAPAATPPFGVPLYWTLAAVLLLGLVYVMSQGR